MAWRASQYFDVEKGAAYPLAEPILAENKATAESFDRIFSSNPNRYYLWNVDVQGGGGGAPPPLLPPDPVTYSPEEYTLPAPPPVMAPGPAWPSVETYWPAVDRVQAPPAPPPQVWAAPAVNVPAAPTPPAILIRDIVGLEDSLAAGSPRLDPIPIEDYKAPQLLGTPNPPEGPRLIDFPPIGTVRPVPADYLPVETFPIPSTPTVILPPTPPDIGLNPRELFPAERPVAGPVLWSTPIGGDGHAAPFNPIVSMLEAIEDKPTKPTTPPLLDPVPTAPAAPRVSWTEDTWKKYREDIDRLEKLAAQVPAAPTPPPTPVPNPPPTQMATNRYSLAGSPGPGETTPNIDSNALLKQALETVGVLANIFVPPTSSAPSPTAAPTPAPPASPWYEQVPKWAWLIAAGVVAVLVLRKR